MGHAPGFDPGAALGVNQSESVAADASQRERRTGQGMFSEQRPVRSRVASHQAWVRAVELVGPCIPAARTEVASVQVLAGVAQVGRGVVCQFEDAAASVDCPHPIRRDRERRPRAIEGEARHHRAARRKLAFRGEVDTFQGAVPVAGVYSIPRGVKFQPRPMIVIGRQLRREGSIVEADRREDRLHSPWPFERAPEHREFRVYRGDPREIPGIAPGADNVTTS